MWTSACLLLLAGIVSLSHGARASLQDFSNGNREFSAAVYQALSNEQPGNFLVSPISVTTVMGLAALGAEGQTFQEMSRGLQLKSDKPTFINIFSEITPLLRGSSFYSLSSTNRLFVHRDFQINQTFQNLAERVFDAGVSNINFEQNFQAADAINRWVEQRTNEKIRNLVTPDDFSATTKMLLVNALYFKGKWMKPFDTYDTAKLPFYTLNGNQAMIDTMVTIDVFNYYENPELDCKFLEMLYEGGEVSMVFVLPNKKNGLRQLEQRMKDVLSPQPYKKEQVRVSIPLFSMETTVQFKPILEKLGIRRVFTPEADLSGIGTQRNNIYIDKVIQKTFINVTEKGTEAAAATAAFLLERVGEGQPFDVIPFIADHPFLFFLKHENGVLFMGRYSTPDQKL